MLRFRSCERKSSPDGVPRFPLLAVICSHSACLPPLPLTLAGVELSSSTHSRGGNKSQRGEAWYSYEKDSKERYRGMHHISEPVPTIQVEWCSTLKHATNQLVKLCTHIILYRESQTLNCRRKKEGTLNMKVRWTFLEWWKIHPPMSVLLLHCPTVCKKHCPAKTKYLNKVESSKKTAFSVQCRSLVKHHFFHWGPRCVKDFHCALLGSADTECLCMPWRGPANRSRLNNSSEPKVLLLLRFDRKRQN